VSAPSKVNSSSIKAHLGIANKRPETLTLEGDALQLFQAGMSYAAIGRQLGRSDRWAKLAVRRPNAVRPHACVARPRP